MNIHHHDSTTAIGTVSGTLLSVFASIDSQDYMKTVILAIVGATASFIVSLLLKWIWKKLFKKS